MGLFRESQADRLAQRMKEENEAASNLNRTDSKNDKQWRQAINLTQATWRNSSNEEREEAMRRSKKS